SADDLGIGVEDHLRHEAVEGPDRIDLRRSLQIPEVLDDLDQADLADLLRGLSLAGMEAGRLPVEIHGQLLPHHALDHGRSVLVDQTVQQRARLALIPGLQKALQQLFGALVSMENVQPECHRLVVVQWLNRGFSFSGWTYSPG